MRLKRLEPKATAFWLRIIMLCVLHKQDNAITKSSLCSKKNNVEDE